MQDGRATRPAIPGGLIAGRVVAIGRRISPSRVGQMIDGLLDGGVRTSADSAGDYIRAGAIAVGVGSWLIGDDEVRGVTERADRVVLAEAHEAGQP